MPQSGVKHPLSRSEEMILDMEHLEPTNKLRSAAAPQSRSARLDVIGFPCSSGVRLWCQILLELAAPPPVSRRLERLACGPQVYKSFIIDRWLQLHHYSFIASIVPRHILKLRRTHTTLPCTPIHPTTPPSSICFKQQCRLLNPSCCMPSMA